MSIDERQIGDLTDIPALAAQVIAAQADENSLAAAYNAAQERTNALAKALGIALDRANFKGNAAGSVGAIAASGRAWWYERELRSLPLAVPDSP